MQTTATSFREIIEAAVRDFAENGYDSQERLDRWMMMLREAAEREAMPSYQMEERLKQFLGQVYQRLIDRGQVLRTNKGVDRFTLERVKPELRLELNRRILASADLIKLNRERMIAETLQRFSGWASSIPPGGATGPVQRQAASYIKKSIQSLPFRERRVHIDQGHKFAANLNDILATAGGAIAMKWKQHWTRNPRHTHKLRDGRVYLIRNSWARERGLVRPGKPGYTDEITKPGEEIYCRCTGTFIYALRDLPPDMLTAKGKAELERVRKELAA